jgi:hypothetical protein
MHLDAVFDFPFSGLFNHNRCGFCASHRNDRSMHAVWRHGLLCGNDDGDSGLAHDLSRDRAVQAFGFHLRSSTTK